MAQADSEKDVKQQHKIAETHEKEETGNGSKTPATVTFCRVCHRTKTGIEAGDKATSWWAALVGSGPILQEEQRAFLAN